MNPFPPRAPPQLGFLISHPGSFLAFRKPALPRTHLVTGITVNISAFQVWVQFDYFGPNQAAETPNPCAILQREEEIFPQGAQEGGPMNHSGSMWADPGKPVIRDQILEMSSQHALNHPRIC